MPPLARLTLIALVAVTLVAPLSADPAVAFDVVVHAGPAPCVAHVPKRPVFATLQDGVSFAPPGATVAVCPGTYVEQVVVTTARLTIEALGVVQVVAPAGPGLKFGFDVNADEVTIRGFDVSGFTGDPDSCGIRVNGASAVTVEHNRVHGNSVGICLLSASDGRVRNNVAASNVDPGNGIRVRFGASNEVSGNTVRDNGWEGIVDEAATSSRIHHNLSVGNAATGIIVNSSTGTVVANNTTRANVNGIIAGFTAGAVIEHNYSTRNGTGVHVYTSTGCTVRRNATPLNTVDGVNMRDVSACTVSRNLSHRNQRDGVAALTLGADNVFERNAALHNANVDCSWDASGPPLFVHNSCGTAVPPGLW